MKKNRTSLYNRETTKRRKNVHYIDKEAKDIILGFRKNITRIKEQYKIIDYLMNKQEYEAANDILRFQIVYVMSALDFFLHEIYVYCFIKIFNNELPKTDRYYEYRVPLRLIEQALYDQENFEMYLTNALIELNSNLTFMAPNRIKELLNIITPEDEFTIAEEMLKKKGIIKPGVRLIRLLDEIYDRRNKIAHQTDINHGCDEKNIITKQEVEYYVDVIHNFVEEVFKIIIQQTRKDFK
ncbi:MAG: hypothetical protein GX490_04670 [Bacilli bacterium]|nr:hypothetical protein [Bacilli bacterium]